MEALFQEFMKNANSMQSFWEQRIGDGLEEAVKSQHFVQAMSKALESSLDMRQFFDSGIGRWAEMYQVVTKKDLAILQQQMFDQNMKQEKTIQLLEEILRALTKNNSMNGGMNAAPRRETHAPTEQPTPSEKPTGKPAERAAAQGTGHTAERADGRVTEHDAEPPAASPRKVVGRKKGS